MLTEYRREFKLIAIGGGSRFFIFCFFKLVPLKKNDMRSVLLKGGFELSVKLYYLRERFNAFRHLATHLESSEMPHPSPQGRSHIKSQCSSIT